METNRTPSTLSRLFDVDVFEHFGEEDSIVDSMLTLPVVPTAGNGSANAWDVGVLRRLEKLLADKMRERLERSQRDAA